MTRTKSAQSNASAAKELRSLASSFVALRILKHAADTPLRTARLRERLRANGQTVDPASLNRTLARLRRHGWLGTRGSLHSLTPAGRKALKLAVSGLKDVVALTDSVGR